MDKNSRQPKKEVSPLLALENKVSAARCEAGLTGQPKPPEFEHEFVFGGGPPVKDFLNELSRFDNAFFDYPNPAQLLISTALRWYIYTLLGDKIPDFQRQAYAFSTEGEDFDLLGLFNLAVAYSKARRGVKGYWIDVDGVVWGENLKQQKKKE